MARGAVSAARMMISEIPRLRVFVASLAPFFNCLAWLACCTISSNSWVKAASATGQAKEELAFENSGSRLCIPEVTGRVESVPADPFCSSAILREVSSK